MMSQPSPEAAPAKLLLGGALTVTSLVRLTVVSAAAGPTNAGSVVTAPIATHNATIKTPNRHRIDKAPARLADLWVADRTPYVDGFDGRLEVNGKNICKTRDAAENVTGMAARSECEEIRERAVH
jgi:hypothetical protein